jgi:hypothetical protein
MLLIVRRKATNRTHTGVILILPEEFDTENNEFKQHATCIVESSATGSALISEVEDAIKRLTVRKQEKRELGTSMNILY